MMDKKEDFLLRLKSNEKFKNFWKEYRDFCKNLETVDVDVFFNALPFLLKKIENDGSSRELIIAVENTTSLNTKFGNTLYSKIVHQDNLLLLQLLPNLLSGLSKVELSETISKIKNLMLTEDSNKIKLAIQSIAKIESETLESNLNFIEFIEKEFNNIILDEKLKDLWPSVLFVCRNKRNVFKSADSLINVISKETNIEIQMELVYYLSYNLSIDDEEELYLETLYKLIPLKTNFKGAYNHLSYTLGDISKNKYNTIIDFLNKWIAFEKTHAKNIVLFEYLLNTIIDNDLDQFEELITNWLNNDNPNFHIAIFELMRVNNIRNVSGLKVSKKLLEDMTVYDIEYITYKILGFIYDKDTSTSMVYSILEYKIDNKPIVIFLSEVFVTYFIFNYYGTIDYLKDQKKDATPKLKKVIDSIIKDGEEYYIAYTELGFLKEFSPSEIRLNYINKIQNKKFNRSYKKNEENQNSFLSSLKNIHLKAGKTSFGKFKGEYSEQMELAKVSSSTELPRGEFIDPIGQKKLRLTWQNHERNQ